MPAEWSTFFAVICFLLLIFFLYRYLHRSSQPRERQYELKVERPLVIGQSDWEKLTPRQQAVARRAARGMSDSEIAHELGITRHTVNDHLKQVYKKLGVNSRTQLANRILDYISRDPP